jgi:very-short-patch-repair endonuclease
MRTAREQHWVLTREQARGFGKSDAAVGRNVRSGKWRCLHTGVFAVWPSSEPWLQKLMAACLSAGPVAVASHRAAAVLHGFDGITNRPIEITTTRSYRPRQGVICHRAIELTPRDVRRVRGIPVTEVDRTLIDLASVLDEDRLEEATESALRAGKTHISRLRRRFDEIGGRGRSGSEKLGRVLESLDGSERPSGSVLETRLRRVIRRGGLPNPVGQFAVLGGRYFIDFAYPGHLVGIEAEGYDPHGVRERWSDDRERRNVLTNLGWRILHFTWDQIVDEPERVVRTIRDALIGPPLLRDVRFSNTT